MGVPGGGRETWAPRWFSPAPWLGISAVSARFPSSLCPWSPLRASVPECLRAYSSPCLPAYTPPGMSLARARLLETLGRAAAVAGLAAFVGTFALVAFNRAGPRYYWLFVPLPEPVGWAFWHVAPLLLTVAPLCFLLGVLALARARRLRAAARRAGLCERCGYDLRGNVSGRCPECGTPVAAGPPRA